MAKTTNLQRISHQLAVLVAQQHPSLLEVPGCGTSTAARILAEVDDVHRLPSEARLASYAGVVTLDASSGRQRRHRLNRALYAIALTQIRMYPSARACYASASAKARPAAKPSAPSNANSSVASTASSATPRPIPS